MDGQTEQSDALPGQKSSGERRPEAAKKFDSFEEQNEQGRETEGLFRTLFPYWKHFIFPWGIGFS
jgi:hypothetical protein